MLARCRCPKPRVFKGDDGLCHRCGHFREPEGVSFSTMQTALEIGKVHFGLKRLREGRPAKYEEA